MADENLKVLRIIFYFFIVQLIHHIYLSKLLS